MLSDVKRKGCMQRFGASGGRKPHGASMADRKVKDPKNVFKKLYSYVDKKRGLLIIVFILVLASSVFQLLGPLLIGITIDDYILQSDLAGLAIMLVWMAGLYVAASVATFLQGRIMVGISQSTVSRIRKDAFEKIQRLPVNYFDTKPRGDLMSRFTNDVENISNTLNQSVIQMFSGFIMLVGTLGMMLYLSPLLTAMVLAVVPVMILATLKIARRTRKLFSKQQKNLGNLNGFAEETISGQKVVKVFCRERENIKRFKRMNRDLRNVSVKAQIYSGVIFPLMNAINNIGFAIVAGAGGYLALRDIITIGVIASFISYSRQFARPINELAYQFNMIQTALAGAERIFEIMDEKPEPKDDADSKVLSKVSGDVALKNVDFSYKKGTPVLKDVTLNVKSGQTIAIVGPTGAGKTTIVNLMTRFYDVDSGDILIDGENIRNIERKSLRSTIGIVLQDTYLFSESVRENIRYGKLDATDEEIINASKLANAHHFIKRLPDGYDTVLQGEGANLSQGQRQLLSIARVILANPSILILDEATSSVDTRTELHIQKAMLNLMKGRTSFVIAHRLSTIRDADKIVVLNDGRIIEEGNHDELIAKKDFYYNLYNSQFRVKVS